MTVTRTIAPHWEYTGDGVQTVFPYTSLVLDAADLRVYVAGVLQTLNVQYTVTGLGVPTGGNVTFTSAPAAVAIDILRRTIADQLRALPLSGAFPSTTVERGLDDAVNMIQEDRLDLGRALLLDLLSSSSGLTLPDPAPLKGLRWKSDRSGLENIDLTTILAAAATLPLAVAQGGTGGITALAARQAFGLDGQVRKVLTNATGVTLAPGDVVAISTSSDSSVSLGDTVSSKAPFAVALAAIAANDTGEFLLSGVVTLKVAGAVTRGRYLRKSVTTKVAEDSGTLTGASTDPPQGAFAIALTSSAGTTVPALVLGHTFPGTTAPTITGVYHTKGLTGTNNSGTPTTQYDLNATFVVVKDPSSSAILVLPGAAKTINMAAAGPAANGRDQAGAFSANVWLHLYWIAKTDGTLNAIASLALPPTGPAMPTGYTLWGYIGAIRWNNSSNIVVTYLRGQRARYAARQAALTSGVATTQTAIDLAAFVPPNAETTLLSVQADTDTTGPGVLKLRVATGIDYFVNDNLGASDDSAPFMLDVPNVGQNLYYLRSTARNTDVHVLGYDNPL